MYFIKLADIEECEHNDVFILYDVPFDKLEQQKILKYQNISHIRYMIPHKIDGDKELLNLWIEQIDNDVLFMPNLLNITVEYPLDISNTRFQQDNISTKKHKFFIKDDIMIIPHLNEFIDVPDTIKHIRIWLLSDCKYLDNLPNNIEYIKICYMNCSIDMTNLPCSLKKLEMLNLDEKRIANLDSKIKVPFDCEVVTGLFYI